MIVLDDILAASGGTLHGPAGAQVFGDWCYDSRLAQPGQMFVAIRTDRRDGHDFIPDALRAGCTGVLCEKAPPHPGDATVVLVSDVREALQRWSSATVQRYGPLVVGVTGSVGKSGTKRTIATLLEGLAPTFASRRSFNSLFGLPLALGRLEARHRFAVLELGVDRFGEMRRLAALFPPTIAVVTNIAPAHLRYLGDEDHIAAEKGDLVRALPAGGLALLNGDDPRVAAMAALAPRAALFGIHAPCLALRAVGVWVGVDGTRFGVVLEDGAAFAAGQRSKSGTHGVGEHQGRRSNAGPPHGDEQAANIAGGIAAGSVARGLSTFNFRPLTHHDAFIPLLGEHAVYIALAAIGVALRCGMDIQQAIERLGLVERQAGRLVPLPGANGSLLLDDTYNASPASAHAALRTLAALPARRRIAVFGDMLELGEHAPRLHREVGAHARRVADMLVTKGDLAALMADDEDMEQGNQGTKEPRNHANHANHANQPTEERVAPPGADQPENVEPETWNLKPETRNSELGTRVRTRRRRVPTKLETRNSVVTYTATDAIAAVRPLLEPGDVVLIKGSAESRMEQVTRGLLAPHMDASAVLVRQERAFSVRAGTLDRPTWLEVDLDAIAQNTRSVASIVGPNVRVLVTLKADAYGHGALRVARTVLQHGAWGFAVATLGEALVLRDAGIGAPILILGYTPPWQVRDAMRRDVRLTVFDADTAREVGVAARDLQREAIVHIKIDTGMARLGMQPEGALPLLRQMSALEGVTVEGIFTHLASADSADETFAHEQIGRWNAVLHAATAEGLRPPLAHAANSATLLRFPAAHYDLVRPGVAIYGLSPSPATPLPPQFRPALSFKTEIAQVKQWPAGAPVSYGGAWVAERSSRIATIPVGYADGFRRSPHWRYVLVRGQRAPLVGRVTMDYAMLDVTDIPAARAGDEVVLIGAQDHERISADDVAGWLGTINYEVVAGILPRVPRVV